MNQRHVMKFMLHQMEEDRNRELQKKQKQPVTSIRNPFNRMLNGLKTRISLKGE